jgi:hypothetical protein
VNRSPVIGSASIVVPNICNDMHDCSVATGDTWLKNHIDSYVQWAKADNSLLILTFDEDDHGPNNQIPTIFLRKHVKAGYYSEQVNHSGCCAPSKTPTQCPTPATAPTTPLTRPLAVTDESS